MHALLRVWHACHRGGKFRLYGLKPDVTAQPHLVLRSQPTDQSEQERWAGLDWESLNNTKNINLN